STPSISISPASPATSASSTTPASSAFGPTERSATTPSAPSRSASSTRGSPATAASGRNVSIASPRRSNASGRRAPRRSPNHDEESRRKANDHPRAHLPGADRRRMGPVDDEGGDRVVVGPGRLLGEGPDARRAPRRSAALRDDRQRAGADRVHEEVGNADRARGRGDVYRGRRPEAARLHPGGGLRPRRRGVRRE